MGGALCTRVKIIRILFQKPFQIQLPQVCGSALAIIMIIKLHSFILLQASVQTEPENSNFHNDDGDDEITTHNIRVRFRGKNNKTDLFQQIFQAQCADR